MNRNGCCSRRRESLSLVTPSLLAVVFLLGLGGGSAWAASFAYIPNSGDNTVSVLDTSTNTEVDTDGNPTNGITRIAVGVAPYDAAVNPADTRVYVTNPNSNTVSVIDTCTNTVIAMVPVGDLPLGVAVHPDGTRAYVANFGSDNGFDRNKVSVIDTATNTVIATVTVTGDRPEFVAVHPAGTFVYVTVTNSDIVSVINTATNTETATVGVGEEPRGVAVHPAGTFVYSTGGDSVSVIDTTTNTVVDTIPLGPLGDGPQGIAVHPDGTRVYVTNINSNNVSVIDTSTNTVVATVPVGSAPRGYGQFIGPLPSCPLTITIDIKPGSFPNSINPNSQGVIPVAILTTSAFDATTVDPNTVLFGATGTEAAPVQSALEDVDGDGDTDLVLHFNTQETGIQCGDTTASLTGQTLGGQAIKGSDSIKTVGCE